MRAQRFNFGVTLALCGLAALAFSDLLWSNYDFVNFDDYPYVRENPEIHAGLSIQSVWWAFATTHGFNWIPLTWISLQLDFELFGMDPRGFHATNLALHIANVVLLYFFLRRGTGAVWRAAAVAAFFAVHPLHVESVAWVTERKDVLSTFFWMLTLLAYTRYAERPSAGRYWLVLLLFVLGLMSKPMVVTLPCVLLLLDYWPLHRWTGGHDARDIKPNPARSTESGPRFASASLPRLVVEKIPFFLVALGACVLAIQAGSELIDEANHRVTFGVRALNALSSYATYLRQMFWPSDLAVLYLYEDDETLLVRGIGSGVVLAAVSLLAYWWRRSRPYVVVGWLWYLGTLVPVLGLLQVAQQARADRFTYVPLIGVFIVLSWGTAEAAGRWRSGRLASIAVATTLLFACMTLTRSQLRYWRDSTSLWNRALQVSGNDPRLHTIVVQHFLDGGEPELAIQQATLMRQLYPDNPDSHRLHGFAMLKGGRHDEALASLGQTVALRPDSCENRRQLAQALWSLGRIPAAQEQYAAIARLEPESAEGRHFVGTEFHRDGKYVEAVRCYRDAVRLAPENVYYHCDLALALEDLADPKAAREHYRDAFDIDPEWPQACARLAWILSTHPEPTRRDGAGAIRYARQACSNAGPRHPPFLRALAAAYAEAGLFQKAIDTASEARRLAMQVGGHGFMKLVDSELRQYQKGQPFRDVELK